MKTRGFLRYLPIIIIGVVVLILGISVISNYNALVVLREDITAKNSAIELRLQQRHDKIGQLVGAVSGLQDHESEIYQEITDARELYMNAQTTEDLIEADAAESAAISRLLVLVEDNPSLISASAFSILMDEISASENTLAVARRDFNLSVQAYNTSVKTFPKGLYASLFGFAGSVQYWEMDEGAGEVPNIVFPD